MEKGRSANKAKGSSRSANSGIKRFPILIFRRNENISDSFTRKGKTFAPGITDYCIVIKFRYKRNFCVSVNKFAVRFVGYKKNLSSEFFFRFGKNFSELFKAFFRKNCPGRVVGGIDYNRGGFFVYAFGKFFKIYLKIRPFAGNNNGFSAGGFNKNGIFWEEGSKKDNFFAFFNNCGKGNRKRSCRSAGEIKIFRTKIGFESFVKVIGDGFSCKNICILSEN